MSASPSLEPATSVADFASQPHGRWLGGESFVYAWPSPELAVTALWGEPGLADFEQLTALFRLELRAPAAPHAAVIDAHRVAHMGQRGFERLSEYVEATREEMRKWVTRLAIVRPDGFMGAVAAGFFQTTEAPYPFEVFATPAEAYAWVNAPAHLEGRLDAIVADITSAPAGLRAIRRAIAARLPDTALASVAKDLGLAARTLQRRLKERETSFRRELGEAQVRATMRWLESTDEPISRIAYEVGCATPQHLSTLFKQATGETPSRWRKARRGGGVG